MRKGIGQVSETAAVQTYDEVAVLVTRILYMGIIC